MAEQQGASEQDDVSFLRTDDNVCLTCTSHSGGNGQRVCLAAEGFGNRMCFLQQMGNKDVPLDVSTCVFVLEQALSVRALQEMVTATTDGETAGQSGGHRTLLYGHAVLLRHSHSNMYLSSLSTSSSNDKLAFDVGLREIPQGESCWWTIHPASKQRSEGEKVRVGDDLILVSVASERYLHIGGGNMVIASFQQTQWMVQPVCSGAIRQKSLGFVFGGDVLRLFHGHMDECFTIPHRDNDSSLSSVMYETGAVCSQARSLWRLEHVRTKWGGGFMGWGQSCRLRHITSGRYLSVTSDNQVVTIHRSQATEAATSFVLRLSKDDRKHSDSREDEGMGTADIKYGDTVAFVQHVDTGLWLSYQTFETKKRGVGRVEEKKAVMLVEGHMDDGLTFSRAQEEESRSARVIRKCTSLFSRFIKALDSLRLEGPSSFMWTHISLDEILMCLEDLIEYFKQPSVEEGHEERQIKLKALRNRQDLFQEEGMIALILQIIDKFGLFKSRRHFAHLAGEDAANKWDDISGYLYLLLAAMIRGNRANCSLFAQSNRLDWLVNRLQSQQSSTGVLDVLHCVLIDSPEALNMIKEQHIRTIISLIDKHGRDPKVLNILCSLCIGNDVAVRTNQNLICDNLLPGRDLLLQTKLVDHVTSMHSNTYVGLTEGSAQYKKWYFEVIIDNISTVTHIPTFFRVGWANTDGFSPYPGGGDSWGACGVGDDLFSYAFDGVNIWTASKPKAVRTTVQQFQKGDIIGCVLDLTLPQISFTVNGIKVKGFFRDFNLDGLFYPVVSVSAYCSFRFVLGGEHGKLKHGPPPEHAPVIESLLPREKLQISPSFYCGETPKGIVSGPAELDTTVFVPQPVDTSHIPLPVYIENVRDKLAENIHESWAMGKIEQGWSFGERRDDQRLKHPCLTTFEKLPRSERQYNLTLAYETLRTILAMGYHTTYDPQKNSSRMKTLKLPNNYLQSNGYKPAPLDLSGITLNDKITELVDLLAENTHNVWAKDRIKQGWTYGLNEDMHTRRSPHLVPYEKVDASIKKANSEVSSETVKTLMAYGYNLEPSTNEAGESGIAREVTEKKQPMRTYRAGLEYAVTSGKWYYEFEVLTPGLMKCGWAKMDAYANKELGIDGTSYVFDGCVGRKWHQGSEPFGKIWQVKDVIGCMIDMHDRTISFSLNGELMMDPMGQEITFKGIDIDTSYVPAFSLGTIQQAKLNFGQDADTLKFFTCCGLQEGYEPFCVNMTRQMSLWYSKKHPVFHDVAKSHPRLEVSRIAGGSSTPPCLKVMSKTFGTLEKVKLEFLRLSLPIRCQEEFVSPRSKPQMTLTEKKKNIENLHPRDYDYESGADSDAGVSDISTDKTPKIITALHRGFGEDSPSNASSRRQSYRKSASTTQSFDGVISEPGVSDTMKRGSNVSKAVHDRNQTNGVKKSKFSSIFRRSRSRDPSPQPKKAADGHKARTLPIKYTASEGEYTEEESDQESLPGGGTTISIHPPSIPAEFGELDPRKKLKPSASDTSFGSAYFSETEHIEMEAMMSVIDEYYYGVRIFPGQDPAHVYVGWVTPGYHMHQREFDMKSIRNVVVCSLDIDYKLKSSISRKNCYIVSAGDLQNRYSHHESDAKSTPGLLIGCYVDTSTGLLSFTVNGKEVANKFQVEPGTMLFPAVFFEPTNKEVLQFELGRTKTTLPLSAALFRDGKHVTPQCPPRLELQALIPAEWSRVPSESLSVHTLKLSDIRGWSLLCEKPVAMLAVYIPEEDRCLDIMELIEHPDLLKFHAETLELYKSVCSHGNHRAAHELINHVDERQLMFCIQSGYLSGPLRMGFHNILITLHLEAFAKSRLTTQNEFIIPLAFEDRHRFKSQKHDDPLEKIRQYIPTLEHSVSIRPTLDDVTKLRADSSKDLKVLTSPSFPLDRLKQFVMSAMKDAVLKGAAHIRDPIGGSNTYLFVPLLKVCDNLLLMGLLDDSDLQQLLCLIDPSVFDKNYNPDTSVIKHGLLDMKLDEAVKLNLCYLLHHLCDSALRNHVETITSFSDNFVLDMQKDQLRRYSDVKRSNMGAATAARKTKEFRCPPEQQVRSLLAFRKIEEECMMCPMSDHQQSYLMKFHSDLLSNCGHHVAEEEETAQPEQEELSWSEKLLQLVTSKRGEDKEEKADSSIPDCFQKLITNTMIKWAQNDFIEDENLVREMFSLIHRQYDGVGELIRALEKCYVISKASHDDINNLLKALGTIRSLLAVQVDPVEEDILKTNIWDLMDNKVFFQHPDLMRALSVHETVMQLMVNTLNNAKQRASSIEAANFAESGSNKRRSSVQSNQEINISASSSKDPSADMVVSCCRFLCYFCRTSRQNQRAMFEHLAYLLENSCMLLSRPSLRGSCPLDVAYSSLMDNNELALALRENNLEKVAIYLARCGIQTNQELLAAGYPDIGWDPVEGERFLDFFRFCVWVNGESVEENANLVVRLLIRRPECLGPALRGAGGGLLKAMRDGIIMSEQIAAARDKGSAGFLAAVAEDDGGARQYYLTESKFNFDELPPEDDEDYIDMGVAILNFYSSLVELLGKCAPDAETIKAGKSDSLRARAILRSLVSMSDLEGVLSLRFILPITTPHEVVNEEGVTEIKATAGLPPGLLPIHKASIVQFLERVYGIEDQATFFRLLETSFLPDLRAATILDTATASESDMALALNRYLCASVLTLLTKHAYFFKDADHASALLDSTLSTAYHLSKCRSLTKLQREIVSDFLVALTSQLRPPMMTKLLKKLTIDVPALTENTVVALRVLTNHYERCGSYYGSGGWGGHGLATDEERRLTMMLFSGIFDSLAQRAYDPELFSKALPCLSAIGCALSPDYTLSNQDENWHRHMIMEVDSAFVPNPMDTSRTQLSDALKSITRDFIEHYHDAWALQRIDQGWTYGSMYDEDKKTHPSLKPFSQLPEKVKLSYHEPVDQSLRAMLAWGWTIDLDQGPSSRSNNHKRKIVKGSTDNAHGYTPTPVDLRSVTVTREMQSMAEKVSRNAHEVWAMKKKSELELVGAGIHPQFVSYDTLTDQEKKKGRERSQELIRFLQLYGYRLHGSGKDMERKRESTSRQSKDSEADSGVGVSSLEKRFAYSLLEKLLEYLDKAALNLNQTKPSARYARRNSYCTATEDVKFFGKVVLPLVERYFRAHMNYFITIPNSPQSLSSTASIKEKEMTASLFSKLALLLRQRCDAFGHDVAISVRCLQKLVQAIDARSVVKTSPEIVRSSLLPFFTNAADDLQQTVNNLKIGRFSHVKGTVTRGATSLTYVHMVLLPVLSSMFEHLNRHHFGPDLLVGDQQLCCYRILNALYTLGTSSANFVQRDTVNHELARHRPALGECLASFASTFPVAFLEPENNKFNKNSILFGISEDKIATHSLEAHEVMTQLAENLPSLEKIIAEIEELAESGGKYDEAPHVIEVTLPMLCSYLPAWWCVGPDNLQGSDIHVTMVTANLMNNVLGNVLKLIKNNIGSEHAPWMNRIATRTQPIIANATLDMLVKHILPVAEKLRDNSKRISMMEEMFYMEKRARHDIGEMEATVQQHFHILVRDMYAFYPLLIKYVDLHRSHWLKNPCFDVEQLYMCVADVFNLWTKSSFFKREEQNFVSQNEIDNRALIMPSQDPKHASVPSMEEQAKPEASKRKRRDKRFRQESYSSLNVGCLKRLLPIGLNMFGGREQELIQQAKQKLIQESEGDIKDFIQMKLDMEEKPMDEKNHWQKMLYKKIGSKQIEGIVGVSRERSIDEVLAMSKVLHGLHLVEHPASCTTSAWKKIVSSQRKRCIMACFRMVPLYNLPRHRAINLFLKAYREQWLNREDSGHATLIEDITISPEEEVQSGEKEEDEELPHPLGQLITAFSRAATTEQKQSLKDDFLFTSYSEIMSSSCSGEDEDDDDESEEDPGKSFQEQEMEKQKLLFEQSRLSDRGAAEMMLLYISASKGEWSANVISTIELGISLLRGGNTSVQKKMLMHLKEKKDVSFFTSVAGLMQQCSVLDLDAFERCNKAESLGVTAESAAGVKNLHDAELTCKLFRFLQLLCEGHNLDFQNYLRTQAGNATTVNIIICTVDYLLRLQESIMDFYWHYSGKETIDPAGKENFCRAIRVAKQVFITITEYIQGPCLLNQLALAHSRLWDAVGGFLYIFAHMQEKLSKDPEQLELLREFMKLQKEMMIMLLSMLEGNVMNGPIGKQMVDTLVESSANFEMILRFFDIFLKMKDLTSSEAFMEFDINKDGVISHKEFKRAMEVQKIYTEEEIEYIMMCVDSNQDGKVDFNEFTDRFHNPAKDIGFNVAVLLTNLSEHMPNDPRLERFMEKAKSVLDYFEPYLGRIEIMGSAGRIERVYFEIKQSNIDQWEKPQIKESKRAFLYSVVNEGGDKEKLESFVNFCEETIFEMQHATSISAEEQAAQFSQLDALRAAAGFSKEQGSGGGVLDVVKSGCSGLKDGIMSFFSNLRPSRIRARYHAVRSMTFKELLLALFRYNQQMALLLLQFLYIVFITFVKFVFALMRGDTTVDKRLQTKLPSGMQDAAVSTLEEDSRIRDSSMQTYEAGAEASLDQTIEAGYEDTSGGETGDDSKVTQPASADKPASSGESDSDQAPDTSTSEDDDERELSLEDEPPIEVKEPEMDIGKLILSVFARNFYNFKIAALVLAFAINFFLLFFKVTSGSLDLLSGAPEDAANVTEEGGDEDDLEEWVSLADSLNYLGPVLRFMSISHSVIAFSMLVAYYCLKVPLVIFKREKEIARKLEFEGLWVAEQPSDDDIKGHWDKLLLSTPSFPVYYWDKFVKKKVRNKYSEQYDYDSISNLLGMDKGDSFKFEVEKPEPNPLLPSFLAGVDWQYQIWKWGVIFTDNSFLYIAWYFSFSVLGNFNFFFFALHLLDVAFCIKTLGAILQSVTHNGKQLVLTVMLLSIIVYLYTVLAFNFFRKFYVQEEEDKKDFKCHDMFTCFVFHLYKGVRAGGGIGDEINPPDGDPYEVYRILFDITFFFFVVVILLAIIQGLIIDAFGELRDQLEQVKEDMESNCFICGIGKDYFDKVPHGFDVHVKNEHDFANYMFFLMHLINKPDTEYTGQETYVYQLYQQRQWDFFPVGDCFRKQYEDEPTSS